MRSAFLVMAIGLGLSFGGSGSLSHVAAAEAPASGKLLRHVVMYKFRDDMTPAQVQEVVDAFKKMVKQIDTVVGFEYGPNLSKEGKSEGLTHVFMVSFKDQDGLQQYLVHPAHAAYAKFAKDRREKVVVVDFSGGD